jgi:hypothetical protein
MSSLSKNTRQDPRTAADLARRGYKVLALPRQPGTYLQGYRRTSPDYKLVSTNPAIDVWYGLIKGPVSRSEAYPRTRHGEMAKRSLGTYDSRISAAHAILDHLGSR